MSTPKERKEVYCTPRWRRLRKRQMQRAGWLCARCARFGYVRGAKIVHHKRPIRQGGKPFEESNLEVVCRACHEELHAGDPRPDRPEKKTSQARKRLEEIARTMKEKVLSPDPRP